MKLDPEANISDQSRHLNVASKYLAEFAHQLWLKDPRRVGLVNLALESLYPARLTGRHTSPRSLQCPCFERPFRDSDVSILSRVHLYGPLGAAGYLSSSRQRAHTHGYTLSWFTRVHLTGYHMTRDLWISGHSIWVHIALESRFRAG